MWRKVTATIDVSNPASKDYETVQKDFYVLIFFDGTLQMGVFEMDGNYPYLIYQTEVANEARAQEGVEEYVRKRITTMITDRVRVEFS